MIKTNTIQGDIFRARNVPTNEEVAIKLSPANDTVSLLRNEYDVLCWLRGVTGIPHTILFDSNSSYNAIIFECLGPSLEEVFESCHRSFSKHTISMIGEQLVCSLIAETFHNNVGSFVDCSTSTPAASFIGISSPVISLLAPVSRPPLFISSTSVLPNCTEIPLHTATTLSRNVVAHWAALRSVLSIATLDVN